MEVTISTPLCRICLGDNHLLPIFDTNLSQQICDKIMACAAVHVALGDPLPHQICKQCHRALEISHLFKTKCEQTDRQLRSIIQDQSTLLKSQSTANTSIKSVQITIEPSNVQIFHGLGNINTVDCGDYSVEDQVEQFHSEIENFDEMSSSYKQEMENLVPDEKPKQKIVQQSNGDAMCFDNEKFHLGELCEVITDDISTPELPIEVSSVPRSEEENQSEAKIVPKLVTRTRHVRTDGDLKPYTCEYCKKSFASKKSLNFHVKNHIGDLPYSCEVCKRGFAQPSVLKRHMLSHSDEHPYQCEICYKTFLHESSLKTHFEMHTITEPQHKCDICEKKFKYLSTLTSHIKTHSGIKPFTCPECRKSFYRRSLLTRHMRSHTKEKPYKCKQCKAQFAYSGGLASHEKLHTGIRPYECELCNLTFVRISHLKNHMEKIHNNGDLLNCERCNMNFDSKPLFKRHLSLHIKREQNLNGFTEDQQPDAEDS